FDPGFLDRGDGWPGLQRQYGLRFAEVRAMEHALTYPALVSGRVDVIDVFSTDGQLSRLDLTLLTDDRRFFPDYTAVLLARRALPERFPRTWASLERRLGGRIDTATMSRLNALADLERRSFAEVAATFLGRSSADTARRPVRELARRTLEHLRLVAISLSVAVLLGLPLGILAARRGDDQGGRQDLGRPHRRHGHARRVHRRRRVRHADRDGPRAERRRHHPRRRDSRRRDGARHPRRLRGARPRGHPARAARRGLTAGLARRPRGDRGARGRPRRRRARHPGTTRPSTPGARRRRAAGARLVGLRRAARGRWH